VASAQGDAVAEVIALIATTFDVVVLAHRAPHVEREVYGPEPGAPHPR
jgi:hypothetical protein